MGEVKKNTFIQGKLQKDLDERLVPDGEYRDATNMRIVTSLSSNAGIGENVLGNEKLTNNNIPDSVTIGAVSVETSGKIYSFVTSPTFDFIYEYDTVLEIQTIILQDTAGRILKFDENNRITGANYIFGNNLIGDQLSWTDGINPPRKIYIETAKTFGLDGFDDNDISVAKRPPFEEPVVELVKDYSITSNYIEGEYFLFAYRYIYEGEEVSSTSFFSESLVTDFRDDKSGSPNSDDPNIIEITINTGDSRVKKIEVLFNQPQSSNYSLIQTLDKAKEGIADSVEFTIRFDNNQTYQDLSEEEVLLIFNNVPQTSKDQQYIGNRLVYLNYTNGYDSIELDYNAEALFLEGFYSDVVSGVVAPSSTVSFFISPWEVIKTSAIRLFFRVDFGGDEYTVSGAYYIKQDDFSTLSNFMISSEAPDFIAFIESIFVDNVFLNTPTGQEKSGVDFDITVTSITAVNLSVQLDTVGATFDVSNNQLGLTNNPTSFLSNNSQEFGIVYYDSYNRTGSVQYLDTGKVFYTDLKTRSENGELQRGAVQVTINHAPPSWAVKYKIVRKDNNYNFNKFFSTIIYKWTEEFSYYLPLLNNEDKNKITIGGLIYLSTDNSVVFRVEEIVSNLPLDGQSTGVISDFGLIKTTLISGDLGGGVPISPAPTTGTIEAFQGGQFNTSEKNTPTEAFYECSRTFSVIGGFHEGNIQDQNVSLPAITNITEGDSYLVSSDQFTGINLERFKYQDLFIGNKYESVNKIRGNQISSFVFKRDRVSSWTYSDVYNIDTSFNGLSTFNLSTGNFRDLPERDGSIQKSHAREGNILIFQEHQMSYQLINRLAYFSADGSTDIVETDEFAGAKNIHIPGEYGISFDPDSFSFWGNDVFFTDKNRGVVMKLTGVGQGEISVDGMRGFFKTEFNNDTGELRIGGYDPVNDEYVLSFGGGTISYNKLSSTWTQFYSFTPDKMTNVQGKFYTMKGSDLYLHNSTTAPRNTFYGITSPSKITFVMNSFPSTVKVLHNLKIEGNKPWNANIKAFKSDSEDFFETTLSSTDFNLREGMWWGYLRRNEVDSTSSKATYGLGLVSDINGNDVTVGGMNCSLTVGDDFYKNDPVTLIGSITEVQGVVLTLSSVVGLSIGDFVYGQKSMRIEGNEMRGYVAVIELELNDTEKIELYGVDTFGIQSNP